MRRRWARPRGSRPEAARRREQAPATEKPWPHRRARRTGKPKSSGRSRRASGPAAGVAGVKWLGIVGWRRLRARPGALRLRLRAHRHPQPQPGLRDPDQLRLLRRRQDRARPVRRPEPRPAIALADVPEHVQDAVVAAEDRTLLDQQGHRPQGHPPRGVQQRLAAAPPRARRRSPSSTSRSSTSPRSAPARARLKEAILSLKIQRQMSKEEILEGYLNTIYFGRGAYGIQAAAQAYFGKAAERPDRQGGRGARGDHQHPEQLRPGERQGVRAGAAGALRLRLDGMADDGHAAAEAEAAQPVYRLPKFPQDRSREPVRRPDAATCSHGPRRAAATSGFTDGRDRRRRPAGHHDVHQEGDGRRGATGVDRASARTSTRTCTSASPRSTRRPVRCAASSPVRTTSRASSTGPSRAARPARRSSRSRSRPALERRLLAEARRSTATRRSRWPATEFDNEGEGGGASYGTRQPAHGHRGLDQHRLRRHGRQHAGGAEKVIDTAIAWASRRKDAPGLDPRTSSIVLGYRDGQPDRHGERLRHDRRRRPGQATSTSSRASETDGRRGRTTSTRVADRPGDRPRTSPRTRRTPCSRWPRSAPAPTRNVIGRPVGRQDRHRHRRRGPRPLVLVRRLHAAARRPR